MAEHTVTYAAHMNSDPEKVIADHWIEVGGAIYFYNGEAMDDPLLRLASEDVHRVDRAE